jgi:hypothetical protein
MVLLPEIYLMIKKPAAKSQQLIAKYIDDVRPNAPRGMVI